MLYLIGLGLGDAKDISVKGLEIIKRCKNIYLESYTSMLSIDKNALEEFYGKTVIVADREMVEQTPDSIIHEAMTEDIAFLVVGDPFGATTHTDLALRAVQKGVKYKIIHNASILTAVGCCGLQLYSFGEVVSICFWTETWRPNSYYEKIQHNRKRGLHTLCLLDIKVKEQSVENLIKGRKIFESPRFMSAPEAAKQLLEIIESKKEIEGVSEPAYTKDTICVGLARLGSDTQQIVASSLAQMAECDLGEPLHSLIITGHLHPIELEMLKLFSIDEEWFENASKDIL